MARIYASFNSPSAAERAAGALLDYGLYTDDLTVVRNGTEQEHRDWERGRNHTIVSNVSGSEAGSAAKDTYTEISMGLTPADLANEDAADEIPSNQDFEPLAASGHTREDPIEVEAKLGISTTTPADAGLGAAKGAGYGLGIGIIAALVSMFLPGVGLVLGSGALAAAIAGAVGSTGAGAIAGALVGYLKDQGVEESQASQYSETIAGGGALLEVNVPSGGVDEERARQVLSKYGASNVGAYGPSPDKKGYVA